MAKFRQIWSHQYCLEIFSSNKAHKAVGKMYNERTNERTSNNVSIVECFFFHLFACGPLLQIQLTI